MYVLARPAMQKVLTSLPEELNVPGTTPVVDESLLNIMG